MLPAKLGLRMQSIPLRAARWTLIVMPLDPNKLYGKKPRLRSEVLLALEWSAIIFAGMLAVLFLSRALALQTMPETGSVTADQAVQTTSDSPATFLP
jgi:hypothetical protein